MEVGGSCDEHAWKNSGVWQRFFASAYPPQSVDHRQALEREVRSLWSQGGKGELPSRAFSPDAGESLKRAVEDSGAHRLNALLICAFPWRGAAEKDFAPLRRWLQADSTRQAIFLESTSRDLVHALQNPHLAELLAGAQGSLHLCQDPHRGVAIELLASELADSPFTLHSHANAALWLEFRQELVERAAQIRGICDELLRSPHTAAFALQNAPGQAKDSDLEALRGAFQGLPAVLCGAGATLQEALLHLPNIAQTGLLIGCGSAALTLQRNAIAQHAVATICPLRTSFERWQRLDTFTAPAWTCLRAYPDVAQMLFGPRLHLTGLSRSPSVLWTERALNFSEIQLDYGGSVLTAALRTCIHLGCNPIFLLGVDLCYSITGEKYAPGIEQIKAPSEGRGVRALAKAAGSAGEEILTNQPWLSERSWIEQLLRAFPETKVYNASSRGLKISGAPHCSYENWLEKHAPVPRDFSNILHSRLIANSPKTARVETFEKLRKSLQRCMSITRQELRALPIREIREGNLKVDALREHLVRLECAFAGELAFDVLLKPMQEALTHVHQRELRQMKSDSSTQFSDSTRCVQLLKLAAHRLMIFQKRGARLLQTLEGSCRDLASARLL